MATAHTLDFASLAREIAERLLDQPNKAMSNDTDLRFGSHGSMSINLDTGQFYDHESKTGGGMLDLSCPLLSGPSATIARTEEGTTDACEEAQA